MKSNAELTTDDFERAAELRLNGATWDRIRSVLECKTDSRVFYANWERLGIEHPPERHHQNWPQ